MKKLLFIGLLLIGTFTVKSQTVTELQEQITVLEQQKELLQEKVNFCDLYNNAETEVKTFNSNFEFKVLECVGNSIEQTVEITVTIKHSLPHQKLELFTGSKKPVAYGETGNNYDFKEATFPNASSVFGALSFNSPTNLLIQGKLVFRNVLPQTEKLSLVNGIFQFKNKDGNGNRAKGEFEIRNLNINWN